MGWSAEDMATFTGLNLGPTMADKGYGHVHIMTMDDQRYLLPKWVKTVCLNRVKNSFNQLNIDK